MTPQTFKSRLTAVVEVFGALIWRGFGLFLFLLGMAGTSGSILTGSWLVGVEIAWLTLMLGVVGALGYAIAITGKATKADVAKGIRDAVEKAGTNNKE
jgi:hypothetical protein